MKKEQFLISCRGRVQGVGFRFLTRRMARQLNLKGYVKNLGDGSVEIVAQGDKESIFNLISYLKSSPLFARVDEVIAKKQDQLDEFSVFSICF